jgi:carbon-monoxide dehydrogenase large subunit
VSAVPSPAKLEATSTRFIGKSLPRTEDARLLRGRGRYTADLAPADTCRMYVVRSPHASALIGSMDIAAAAACPGVRLVIGPDDAEIAGFGSFTSRVRRTAPDGRPNFVPDYRALSVGRARFVGDVVAAIFADTMDQAKDAADALQIEWTPLPAITETRLAADPGMPRVWDEVPNNVSFLYDAGKPAEVEAALAAAPHVVTFSYPVNRVLAAPMETRTALATYDPAAESYTLWAGLQNPHFIREELAGKVLGIDGNRLRVVAPDTGGAFGLKESPFPEHVLALVGARRIGRPVLWVCERTESFIADHHARDHYSTVTLGLDHDGNFLALRIESLSNLGAYLSFNGVHTATNNLGGLSGLYRTPLIHARIRGVFTNTPPTSPYRGAGRPEATYAIERAIDLAARRFGFDRVELRRRNMIAPSQMPYKTGFVFTYDSGEFERNMDDALRLMDWDGFPARREAARARGRLAGIGLANAIEIANGPITGPFTESAEIRFDATGSATVLLGVHSQGQGHEITFAQIAAELLGLRVEEVKVRYGDTDQIEHGTGSFGSRSVVAGGTALTRVAQAIIERGRVIAAAQLEADEADIEFDGQHFGIAGTDRRLSTREVARLSYQLEPDQIGGRLGLAEKRIVAPSAPTFPNGCHVCEVEIDPETGHCDITGYCVVDDVGRVINPRLVKGQIHGGVAQGIGQILLEDIRYDEAGQLMSGSFMDYAMPRASDLPSLICKSNEVPTPTNPIGAKGAGEAGTVGALAAVINAISDALAPLGVEHVDMPATPDRIWRTIQAAGSAR